MLTIYNFNDDEDFSLTWTVGGISYMGLRFTLQEDESESLTTLVTESGMTLTQYIRKVLQDHLREHGD